MRVVVIPAPFKGSASSETIAQLLTSAVRTTLPGATVDYVQLSDGGTGFRSWVARREGAITVYPYVQHLTGVEAPAPLSISLDEPRAFFEIAEIAGLAIAPPKELNPMSYSSVGVGQMILKAHRLGKSRITIGCGDSGLCDGGIGAASSLGATFYDAAGRELTPAAAEMRAIERVDLQNVPDDLREAKIIAVGNQAYGWCGQRGAVRLFGQQKGLTEREISALDSAFNSFANAIAVDLDDPRTIAGAGAAGGIAGLLAALFGAEIIDYRDYLKTWVDLGGLIEGADLVITGEGRLDRNTSLGKLPHHILQVATKHKVPCVAVVGSVAPDAGHTGFARVVALMQDEPFDDVTMAMALPRMREALGLALQEWQDGQT